jgi:hypothetical protein
MAASSNRVAAIEESELWRLKPWFFRDKSLGTHDEISDSITNDIISSNVVSKDRIDNLQWFQMLESCAHVC